MKKIISTILASLMALGLTVSPASASSVQDNPDLFVVIPEGECTPYLLLGWRGSGEKKYFIPKLGEKLTALEEVSEGIGETIGVVYQQLQANRYFKGKVATAYSKLYNAEALPEPSGSKLKWDNYLFDVGNGNTVHFQTTVKALAAKCPNSKFIIAGYSQGAAIPAYSFKSLTADEQKKIIGIYLVGDPGKQGTGMLPVMKYQCNPKNKTIARNITFLGLIESACAKKPSHNASQVVSPTLKNTKYLAFVTYSDPDDLVANFTKTVKNPTMFNKAKKAHSSYRKGESKYRSITDSFIKKMEINEKILNF